MDQEWERIYKSFSIYMRPNCIVLPKPTRAELDAFEAARGWRLPSSYCTYAMLFGAGELVGEYDIAAPGYVLWPNWDLLQFSQRTAAYFTTVAEDYEDSDLVTRLFYFASSKGSLTFGWDVGTRAENEANEYPIYQVSNASEPELVATSFRAFIESVCLVDVPEEDDLRMFCPAQYNPTTERDSTRRQEDE